MTQLSAGSTCCVLAPAKINLFLEVLGKRDDGFHEIETLMTAISIHDTLYFESTREDSIRLTCNWASGMEAKRAPHGRDAVFVGGCLPAEEENLAWQAVQRFRAATGIAAGASMRLIKRVPAAAGLGGASSDAAAALLAANHAWKQGWPRSRLAELAAELGSDVPFFLQGKDRSETMALCQGRGEKVLPVPAVHPLHLVVVRPPIGLSTAEIYRHCRPADQPAGVASCLEALHTGRLARIGSTLFNRLEAVALERYPALARVPQQLAKLNLVGFGMSGSGSSFFGLCRHRRQAQRVAQQLRARNIGLVFAATTSPTRCHLATGLA